MIEYSNRLLTGFVGLAVIAAAGLAWLRRPFRGHLVLFGTLLPLGVVGQAILGALVVKYHLAPHLVMMHFILSMILLDAAFALAWCSRYEPGERARATDRLGVWAVRGLIPVGQLTILLGTMATAAGPHAGSTRAARPAVRLQGRQHPGLDGRAPQRAGRVLRRLLSGGVRPADAPRRRAARRPALAWMLGLLALQGALGIVQYQLELPAELVWVHIVLATLTWLAVLWTVARAGRLAPRTRPAAA